MFGQIADMLNANQINNDPRFAPWLTQNGGGSALGRAGSALGGPGSALGGGSNVFNAPASASLGSAPTTLGSSFGATSAPSLTGVKSANDLTLNGGGKAGGAMSGMNMANMGVGMATAAGLPQAIFGRTAGNALGSGASGAMTGLAMGGPVGGAVGGGLGLLAGLLGGGQRRQGPPVPVTPYPQDTTY